MIYYSYQEYREQKLVIYQSAIDEWETKRRTEFNGLQITVSHNSVRSNTFEEWSSANHMHVLDHDSYGELPTYAPMMYHLFQNASEVGFTETYSNFNTSLVLDIPLEITDGSKTSTVLLSDIPPYFRGV